jgi:hypothetical protein|nr:MAG TPA: nucleoid-associated protein [Caudoviricetes sp.]
MDIVLERVLSLIPKGKNGKYAHGAKVKFAKSIGYNDGSIVSMWENGTSVSYTKKLHQIADIYNVSVEWLKGETDDPGIKKAPGINAEGLSAARKALLDAVDGLTDEQCEKLLGIVLEAKRVL